MAIIPETERLHYTDQTERLPQIEHPGLWDVIANVITSEPAAHILARAILIAVGVAVIVALIRLGYWPVLLMAGIAAIAWER